MNLGKNHLPRQQANDVAVALFVQVGDFCAPWDPPASNTASDRGWRAVVASSTRPQGRAQVFKVSHHGSDNAHHQDVWRLMLESSPVAVLTPFAREPLRCQQLRIRSGWSLYLSTPIAQPHREAGMLPKKGSRLIE